MGERIRVRIRRRLRIVGAARRFRLAGDRRTSFFFDTTTQEGVGPWHTLSLPGNRIAVTVGASGQVLFFDLNGFTPCVSAPMTAANSTSVLEIRNFVLGECIAESNTYSIATDAVGNFYVADAAANAIVKVTTSGQMSVFATFPDFPNPLPFGLPTVDAVPTRILAKPDGGFYVSQLTGFPFLDGAANVFSLDSNGVVSLYAGGLTQLTDLALDTATGDLYTLQVGQFVLDPMMPPGYAPNSAKVTRIKTDGALETVAENFNLSAGMALDTQGNLYTSEIASGRLLKWEHVTGTLTLRFYRLFKITGFHHDHLRIIEVLFNGFVDFIGIQFRYSLFLIGIPGEITAQF